MKLSFIEPRIELKPYIQSIWVFESQVGLPVSDISLAAPNGCPKLIVNCENSLISTAQGRAHVSPEQSLSVRGDSGRPCCPEHYRQEDLFHWDRVFTIRRFSCIRCSHGRTGKPSCAHGCAFTHMESELLGDGSESRRGPGKGGFHPGEALRGPEAKSVQEHQVH